MTRRGMAFSDTLWLQVGPDITKLKAPRGQCVECGAPGVYAFNALAWISGWTNVTWCFDHVPRVSVTGTDSERIYRRFSGNDWLRLKHDGACERVEDGRLTRWDGNGNYLPEEDAT